MLLSSGQLGNNRCNIALKVWSDCSMHKAIDLSAFDAHGDVYTDGKLYVFFIAPFFKHFDLHLLLPSFVSKI